MAGLCIRSIALAEVALLVHCEEAFLFQNAPFFSVFFFRWKSDRTFFFFFKIK